MGMTLLQLLQRQPPYIINHAGGVVIKNIQERVAPKTNLPAVTATAIDTESGSVDAEHNCQIVAIESPNKRNPTIKNGWVKVSCGCDWFKYYCLPGDMEVLTADGYKTIESLHGPDASKLSVSYLVDGKIHKGTPPYKTGKKKTITITLENGRKLRCTPEHQILTISKSKLDSGDYSATEWVYAAALTNNHLVVCDSALPEKSEPKFDLDFYDGLANGLARVRQLGRIFDFVAPANVLGLLEKLRHLKVVSHTELNDGKVQISVRLDTRDLNSEEPHVVSDTRTYFYGYLSGLISVSGVVTNRVAIADTIHEIKDLIKNLSLYGHNLAHYVEIDFTAICRLNADSITQLKDYLLMVVHVDKAVREIPSMASPVLNVSKIKELKANERLEEVYDISVPDVSKFIAEGIVVHNCEYALSKHGAANIRHSNGMPASVTNPSNYPLLCIAEDQLVSTSTGDKEMRNVCAGDHVHTPIGLNRVLATMQTGSDVPVIRLSTSNGNALVCTPNHEVFKIPQVDGSIGWQRADSHSENAHYVINIENFVDAYGFKPVTQDPGEKIPFSFDNFLNQVLEKAIVDFAESGGDLRQFSSTHNLSICRPDIAVFDPRDVAKSLAERVYAAIGFIDFDDMVFTRERALRFYQRMVLVLTNPNLKLHCENLEWIFRFAKFDKVLSIEDAGTRDVYDITVENANCFFASNVLVHNCKHLYALGRKVLK